MLRSARWVTAATVLLLGIAACGGAGTLEADTTTSRTTATGTASTEPSLPVQLVDDVGHG